MKGIVLAGGSATRLYPATRVVSKQLLPVGDKPMIYYPLAVLLQAGIRDVLLISTPRDLPQYRELLGDGQAFGMNLSYCVQPTPGGLAQAFILGEEFINREPCCLILGDNVFYGHGFVDEVRAATTLKDGAIVFGYQVSDPSRYGVVEFAEDGTVLSIEEKPKSPRSRYAIPGLYFFDGTVSDVAKQVKPSERGEVEITDVHNHYLRLGQLKVNKLGRGIAWLDTGTYESLLEASNFINTIQKRQGLQVGCLEEIAYNAGYIQATDVRREAAKIANTEYGTYLADLVGP